MHGSITYGALAVLSVVCHLTLPQSIHAAEKTLDQAQIVEALAGKTAAGEYGGRAFRQYFGAEGETVYLSEGGRPDKGKWRASENNEYCSWWMQAGWTCYRMTGEGERVTWLSDGTAFHARMTAGRHLTFDP